MRKRLSHASLRAVIRWLLPAFHVVLLMFVSHAAEPFRTDGGDEKLPWFQLKSGEFPPEGSAHYIAGELIALDHVNRTGVLRPDRTDAQRRGDWDLPLPFELLPYGSLSYHGAPAELRDIPIGTHLHGQFFLAQAAPAGKDGKPAATGAGQKLSTVGAFTRVLRLEDDFSFCQRQQREWRVEAVDLEKGTLLAMGITAGKPDAKPTMFQIGPSARVWKGQAVGSVKEIAAGQMVLLNLTVCTLKGPGRVVAIWLDEASREAASAHQREVHRQFQREHGLPGYVRAVDNAQGTVTVAMFAGFDPKLREEFVLNESATAAVAEDNLRTWDQINDRKSGPILRMDAEAAGPGFSGWVITFKPALLLEGFRPGRIVRLWAGKWKVDDLPREERLYY